MSLIVRIAVGAAAVIVFTLAYIFIGGIMLIWGAE
jgi:hypothetical protein